VLELRHRCWRKITVTTARLRPALMGITTTIRTHARLTATTVRAGSLAESSLEPALGITAITADLAFMVAATTGAPDITADMPMIGGSEEHLQLAVQ
jgi:hypothetical protein